MGSAGNDQIRRLEISNKLHRARRHKSRTQSNHCCLAHLFHLHRLLGVWCWLKRDWECDVQLHKDCLGADTTPNRIQNTLRCLGPHRSCAWRTGSHCTLRRQQPRSPSPSSSGQALARSSALTCLCLKGAQLTAPACHSWSRHCFQRLYVQLLLRWHHLHFTTCWGTGMGP